MLLFPAAGTCHSPGAAGRNTRNSSSGTATASPGRSLRVPFRVIIASTTRRSVWTTKPLILRCGASAEGGAGQDGAMPSRIAVIAIDAVQARVVADFWCQALGWRTVEEDDSGISIAPPDGAWPTIDVLAVPDEKVVKNRLHLDLRADNVATSNELDRLLHLGARRADVGQGPDVSWVVLADPEGNEFCLLARSVQEVLA